MTYEDVKRILANPTAESCEYQELQELIDNAIELQIPKKPILHHFYECDEDYSYYTCHNRCSKYCQVNKQDSFCRICGQRIDWSDI